MLLFGVRLLLNLFEMMIYRRFLEVYIGRRKTGTELSLLLMGICAGVSSLVNLLENSTLNLLYTPIMLWLFALQYRVNAKSRVFAVFIYMGINFVTEPIGYILHMYAMGHLYQDETASYFILAFVLEFFRFMIVEVFCRIRLGKKISFSMLPRSVAGLLCCIPFISVICCILLIEIATRSISGENGGIVSGGDFHHFCQQLSGLSDDGKVHGSDHSETGRGDGQTGGRVPGGILPGTGVLCGQN